MCVRSQRPLAEQVTVSRSQWIREWEWEWKWIRMLNTHTRTHILCATPFITFGFCIFMVDQNLYRFHIQVIVLNFLHNIIEYHILLSVFPFPWHKICVARIRFRSRSLQCNKFFLFFVIWYLLLLNFTLFDNGYYPVKALQPNIRIVCCFLQISFCHSTGHWPNYKLCTQML